MFRKGLMCIKSELSFEVLSKQTKNLFYLKCPQKGAITHQEKLFAKETILLYSLKSQIVINILKNICIKKSTQISAMIYTLEVKEK